MGMTKAIQAKYIGDDLIYAVIEEVREAKSSIWASQWDIGDLIRESFTGFPQKVILAKLRNMVESGKLWGCACGCRGDFSRRVKDVPRF